ncbi:MAG: ParB N-terminal domain-containing protein [Spirochaetales bacterium]|nr:ParB N-terminal domain-containing protein [Spirochaetales bacterium]
MDKESQDIYQVYVLEDLKNLGELSHPVRAGLLERLLVRNISLNRLHANPDDEFSDPATGPNYEIVGNYRQKFVKCRMYHIKPDTDPLTVEKLSTGGYRLLNGHHRWMAMRMINMKRTRITIVNTIPASKIISAIEKSENDKCISFDLDEVLICDGKSVAADRSPRFPFNLIYRERIRQSIGACFKELGRLGFDIWVYTGSYRSKGYMEGLLRHHRAKVDGIMNGLKAKRPGSGISKAFKDKYKVIVHADNDSVVWIDTGTREFEDIKVSSDDDWASQVIQKVRQQMSGKVTR